MADTQGMARTSTRSLWKGAITFGLVHIPIGLHSATEESDVDFDWLDRRTLDPVGYKRINKRTGREIDTDNVVKGVEYGNGRYVVLAPEEIAAKAGDAGTVEPLEEAAPAQGADVIDLTELLRRSLKGGAKPAPARSPAPAKKAAPAKTARPRRAA